MRRRVKQQFITVNFCRVGLVALCLFLFGLNIHFHTSIVSVKKDVVETRVILEPTKKSAIEPVSEPTMKLVSVDNTIWAETPRSNTTTHVILHDHDHIDDGVDSQYGEVEWVRGVQERRKLGIEPGDEDPYALVADKELQPFFSDASDVFSLSSLHEYAYRWRPNAVREMHFVHIPK
jgi:hypothetical protein